MAAFVVTDDSTAYPASGIAAGVAEIHLNDDLSRRSVIKLKQDEELPDSDSEDESEEEFFDKEKIKKKFQSAWNSVKYGK